MSESLKSKTVSGVLWSAIERFSLQGVQFIINILMARLLLPSDYGMIGMLAVFLQISQTFIDSGFSDALVQKKDRTETDLSTVFYFNIIISVLLYILLFIGAPYIAQFYRMLQSLLNASLTVLLFFYYINWRPLKVFSKESFQRLFSFGSKLLFSRLIHALYYNLYSLVIGRKYSSAELGYYTRAEQFLYSLIAAYLNSYYTKSLIGLSFMEQVKDIYPSLLLALFMGGVVFISIGFITHPALQLLAGILIGSSCYLFISYWLHFEALHEILSMVKR